MKTWKKILIIMGIILLVLAIFIGRKMWILKNLQNKVSHYTQMSNYYVKITSKDSNVQKTTTNDQGQVITTNYEQTTTSQTYKKDNKYLVKVEILSPDDLRRIINYSDGEKINTYIETKQEKIAILNSNGLPGPSTITDYWSTCSIKEFMKFIVFSKITSEEYRGKDCYKIHCNYVPELYLVDEEISTFDMYFEKETGLLVNSELAEFEYEFNCVTDSDLVEPDISQYTIQQ